MVKFFPIAAIAQEQVANAAVAPEQAASAEPGVTRKQDHPQPEKTPRTLVRVPKSRDVLRVGDDTRLVQKVQEKGS